MGLQKILEALSPIERKVLPFVKNGLEMRDIAKNSNITETEAMRALQWLENKGAIKVTTSSKERVELGENGKVYAADGLPEKRFLSALKEEMGLDEIKKATGLDDNEIKICLGLLKAKYAISVNGNKIKPTSERERILEHGFAEETFLKGLPKNIDSLTQDERAILTRLLKRRDIIKKTMAKFRYVEVTDLGRKLTSERLINEMLIENLTPKMLKDKTWLGKKFRRYDIKTGVPRLYVGGRQPYGEFLQNVRDKLISMGFKEMQGPVIELEFFNFDSLFQPQNHPARDWSATYRIKEPKHGSLPGRKLVLAVKEAHENGVDGSTGWGYAWNEKTASQLMPRAHDTAISPRFLAKGVESPGKYFSLVRCFRPDVIDARHGVEFNQLGGFVIDKNLSFLHLLGLLRHFVFEITGIKDVKFLPDYFPFTEPSVQVSARHPEFGWIELAGAGVFRPELLRPLGVREPVIAWGFGLERLAMMKLGINDIRDLFSNDIEFLRKAKKVL